MQRGANSLVGKNIPLTDCLSQHPIAYGDVTETERERDESEAEEDYVINPIYGLYNFIRTNGSTTQYPDGRHRRRKLTNYRTTDTHMNETKIVIPLKRML